MPNFSFLGYVISTKDTYMAKNNKSNQTKPKTKPNKPSKTPWIILFCEWRLHAKFQLPRLCLFPWWKKSSGGIYAVQEGYIDVQGGYLLNNKF